MDLTRSVITRQHVVGLLPLMGLSPEQEARLLALHHPVPGGVAGRLSGACGLLAEGWCRRPSSAGGPAEPSGRSVPGG